MNLINFRLKIISVTMIIFIITTTNIIMVVTDVTIVVNHFKEKEFFHNKLTYFPLIHLNLSIFKSLHYILL